MKRNAGTKYSVGRWNGSRNILGMRSVGSKSLAGKISVYSRSAEKREILQLQWRNINMFFNGS